MTCREAKLQYLISKVFSDYKMYLLGTLFETKVSVVFKC